MCPVCVAAAALIAGKVTSTGGVAALVVKKFRGQKLSTVNDASKSSDKPNHEGEKT
jgi:hypothetical protein